jgi:hypothetical protein
MDDVDQMDKDCLGIERIIHTELYRNIWYDTGIDGIIQEYVDRKNIGPQGSRRDNTGSSGN